MVPGCGGVAIAAARVMRRLVVRSACVLLRDNIRCTVRDGGAWVICGTI